MSAGSNMELIWLNAALMGSPGGYRIMRRLSADTLPGTEAYEVFDIQPSSPWIPITEEYIRLTTS